MALLKFVGYMILGSIAMLLAAVFGMVSVLRKER